MSKTPKSHNPASASVTVHLRPDFDGNDLRGAASGAGDFKSFVKATAIALLYDGFGPAETARLTRTSPQTLNYWVIQFNEGGLAALTRSVGLRSDFDGSRVAAFGENATEDETLARCAAISALYAGTAARDIERLLGLGRGTAKYWAQRFNEEGKAWLLGKRAVSRTAVRAAQAVATVKPAAVTLPVPAAQLVAFAKNEMASAPFRRARRVDNLTAAAREKLGIEVSINQMRAVLMRNDVLIYGRPD